VTTAVRVSCAGLAGGLAFNVAMLVTFRLFGFGLNEDGPLLDPALQASKLIAVWTTLEPRPLIVARPFLMACGLVGFAVLHAAVYASVRDAWPPNPLSRATRLAALLLLQFAFWEFFTPFNLFGEPLGLIGLELSFWAVIAAAEALAIVSVFHVGDGRHRLPATTKTLRRLIASGLKIIRETVNVSGQEGD